MGRQHRFPADGARDNVLFQVPSPAGAVLPPVVNGLQVQFVPELFREQPLGVSLGLHHVFAGRQSPPVHEPVDMGVYRESGNAKGL